MSNTDTPCKRNVPKKSALQQRKSTAGKDSPASRNSPTPKLRGTIGIGKSKCEWKGDAGSDSDNSNSNSNSDLEESDAYTPRKPIVRTGRPSWRSTVRNCSSTSTNSLTLLPSSRSRNRKLGVDFVGDSSSDTEELSTDTPQKSPVPTPSAYPKTTTQLSSSKSRKCSRLQASGMKRKPMMESVEDTNTDSDIEVINMRIPQKSPEQTLSTLRKSTVGTSTSTPRKSSTLRPGSSDIEVLYSRRLQPYSPNTPLVNRQDKKPAPRRAPLSQGGKWSSEDMDTFYPEEDKKQKELDRLRTKINHLVSLTRFNNVETSPQTSSASQRRTVRTSSSMSGKSSRPQPSSIIRKPTAQSLEDTDADSQGTNNDSEDANTDSDIEELDIRIPQKSLLQTSSSTSRKSTVPTSSSTSQKRSTLQPSSSDIEELYTRRSPPHSPNTPLINRRDNVPSPPSASASDDEISSSKKWWTQDMDAFHLARSEQKKKELDGLHEKFNHLVGRAPFNNQEPKLWDDSLKVVERWAPAGTTRIKVIDIANDFFKHERVWPCRRTDIDKLKKKLCRTDNISLKSYERSKKAIIQPTSPEEETEGNREWWRFSSSQQRIEREQLEAEKLQKLRLNFIQHVGRMPYSEHEPRLWEEGIQIVKKWSYSSSCMAQQMLIANDYFEFTSEWPVYTSDLKKLKEHLSNEDHRKAVAKKRREDMVARERIKEAVTRDQQQQRHRKKHLHTVKSGRVEKR